MQNKVMLAEHKFKSSCSMKDFEKVSTLLLTDIEDRLKFMHKIMDWNSFNKDVLKENDLNGERDEVEEKKIQGPKIDTYYEMRLSSTSGQN